MKPRPSSPAVEIPPAGPCGVVARVAPRGVGQRAGLRPGDCLVSINGQRPRDAIDVQFLCADENLEFVYRRGEQLIRRRVRRGEREGVGLDFGAPLFDGLCECDNHCPFCFVRQMPAGLRPTLYIFDDDYRYSFLHGGFVTLTNLTEEDWSRLEQQRLSPLYVSVHATDPALRARLLGRRDIPPILEQLGRLLDLGIEVHTQIVVVPEINDGAALIQTVEDLAALYPGVLSIGIVPVGLTRFHAGRLRRNTPAEAERALKQVEEWQRRYRQLHGLGLVYASDEWYLVAGQPLPPAEYYDDYPQLENGVGLTRQMLDDWETERRRVERRAWAGPPVACLCGTLIAPILRQVLADLSARSGIPLVLIPAPNHFFGAEVTVSGLLTAGDVLAAMEQTADAWSAVCLPRSMFNAEATVTLDDWSPARLAGELGLPVHLTGAPSAILTALFPS